MLLSLVNLGKSFGAQTVFSGITADINEKNRIGIIGENGAGKTTLLRVINGELLPDEGDFVLTAGVRIGYLKQNADLTSNLNIYEEMQTAFNDVFTAEKELREIEKQLADNPQDLQLVSRHTQLVSLIESRDGYNTDMQIKKVLNGMAFGEDTWKKPLSVLSGGERTRLSLAKILLTGPDILILDEPTNHLDFEMLQWLEAYLNTYRGAIIAVSHDRYFLDAVATHIWEFENNSVNVFKGNYSAYLPQKKAAVELQQKKHDADVEKAKKLQDYVDKNLVRASTTKMAQSRRKQLEKMEITEAPKQYVNTIKLKFEYDTEPYNDVLTAEGLCVAAGGVSLINNLDLKLLRGERLIIAGANGTGKSTLLKVLCGMLRPAGGRLKIGSGVKLSYFEQQQAQRYGTVIDAIWNKYPRMTELEVRSFLALFGFKGEDVFKNASMLSGGELSRLRLSEICLERPNMMLLDEPTNHLDIYTREMLGEALSKYTGTLITVTHDRYFMKTLNCPILYIEKDGYKFYKNCDDLLARKEPPQKTSENDEKKEIKPQQNLKAIRRRKAELRNEIKDIEAKLEQCGADIVEMENSLNLSEIVSDHIKLQQLCDDLEDAKLMQNDLYEKWGELMEEFESITE